MIVHNCSRWLCLGSNKCLPLNTTGILISIRCVKPAASFLCAIWVRWTQLLVGDPWLNVVGWHSEAACDAGRSLSLLSSHHCWGNYVISGRNVHRQVNVLLFLSTSCLVMFADLLPHSLTFYFKFPWRLQWPVTKCNSPLPTINCKMLFLDIVMWEMWLFRLEALWKSLCCVH